MEMEKARLAADRGATHRPSRRLLVHSGNPADSESIHPRDLATMMTWLGIVAGLLELAVVLVQRSLIHHIPVDTLRTNRHFVWMIPAGNLMLFAAVGLALAALSRRRSRTAVWLLVGPGIGLLALAPLLAVEGLYTVAAIALAVGLAVRIGPILSRHGAAARRAVQASLPVFLAGLVLLIGVGAGRVLTAERRALGSLPAAAPGSPNVLLIVMDNVRAESTSLNGHDRPTTPRLEQLARQGVRFADARSTTSWTLPSHASMLTGRWHHELSVGWDVGLDATYPTLAEYLASNGYATAGFVANTYYCHSRYGLDRGFARYGDFVENETISPFEVVRSTSLGKRLLSWFGYSMKFAPAEKGSRKSAERINADALAWLTSSRPPLRPFFVFLNYYDAHAPFSPPDDTPRRFGLHALPKSDKDEIARKARLLARGKLTAADGDRDKVNRDNLNLLKDGYETCIASLDDRVGRLIDELRGRHLLENTLVIVTSDHGEHFAERGFCGHGLSLYRRELHVPLVIVPPAGAGDPSRRTVPETVSLRDLPATVVDLIGLEGRSPFPGSSLATLYRADRQSDLRPAPALSEVAHQTVDPPTAGVPSTLGPVKAIAVDGRVYIRNLNGPEELYDTTTDPYETRNLAASPDQKPVLDHYRSMMERALAGEEMSPPARTTAAPLPGSPPR